MDRSSHITKKLKLAGCTFKIYKNTAFICGIINSELEVAKFAWGRRHLQCSGICGQVRLFAHSMCLSSNFWRQVAHKCCCTLASMWKYPNCTTSSPPYEQLGRLGDGGKVRHNNSKRPLVAKDIHYMYKPITGDRTLKPLHTYIRHCSRASLQEQAQVCAQAVEAVPKGHAVVLRPI